MAREPSRVDARNSGDQMTTEKCFKIVLRPPITRMPREITHNDAATRWRRRLIVVRVASVVPNVRVGERNDLARIRRIRHDLLVARQRGIEDDFTNRDSSDRRIPNEFTFEDLTVGQH